MNDFEASAVIWRRLIYMLTPQMDIYENLRKVVEGKRVLEIGFGTGIGVLQYAAWTEYVDAVEVDQAAVAFARKVLPLRNVRWIHDDISNPTRNYRGYDLVVMIEVLEHIFHRKKTIAILKRALRPGGHGIITVPNSLRYRRRREGGNLSEWTPEEIKYFVDGVVVRTVENTHWHQPLSLIFDSETMPDWFGIPEDEDLPSTFSIEYVRAWKGQ